MIYELRIVHCSEYCDGTLARYCFIPAWNGSYPFAQHVYTVNPPLYPHWWILLLPVIFEFSWLSESLEYCYTSYLPIIVNRRNTDCINTAIIIICYCNFSLIINYFSLSVPNLWIQLYHQCEYIGKHSTYGVQFHSLLSDIHWGWIRRNY